VHALRNLARQKFDLAKARSTPIENLFEAFDFSAWAP
jgi:hypothetical protein